MNKKLDRIESQLRKIFEENLLRLFSKNQSTHILIDDLISAMKTNFLKVQEGQIYAPDQFILHVPPTDIQEWQSHQKVLDDLAASIYETGLEEGFSFRKHPSIKLLVDPQINNHNFSVSAFVSPRTTVLPDTAAMTQPDEKDNTSELPNDAFLVIGGKTNFPLEKPLINIGRHSDNDLILNDLHVSRHHAQLRAINHNFVIFDVGSTGGLYLNEKLVVQATLQSGDVIRIGTVNLIYIQDTTAANPTSAIPIDTQEHPPGGNIK